MSRVIVIGGHGKVALRLHPLLANRGDHPTGIIRTPSHAKDLHAVGAAPLVADMEQKSVDEMAELMAETDAIVWTAGAGGGNPERTYAVDRDAAIRSIDAAKKAGVRRYVMVSYFGAGPDHGVPEDSSFHPYAEAKAAADEHLRASGLDWTILGPSRLTLEDATGGIDVPTPGAASMKSEVPREDVAAVIAAVLADDSTIGRTIEFNAGGTPIAEALAAH